MLVEPVRITTTSQTPEYTDVSEERINTWVAAKFADISKVCFIVPVIS